MALTLTPNIQDPDTFYAALLACHDGLSQAESAAFNARLILVLVDHIVAAKQGYHRTCKRRWRQTRQRGRPRHDQCHAL